MSRQLFHLWAFGDAHIGSDIRHGRESLADALRQAETEFPWEIALNVGDYSGGQDTPDDEEGEELIRQFGALRAHPREAIYDICGNHDRSGLDEPEAWWWRKWVDPTGEHTEHSGVDPAKRPYAIEGTWERYKFQVGNLVFLMMSDINEPSQTVGRGDLGGNPGGVVSGETFAWWKDQVAMHKDDLILSAHHYVLKDTTVASGEWEGMTKDGDGNWQNGFHGYKPQGSPKGASYLYWVDGVPDAMAFEKHLEANPGAVDLWLGGHTHTHPDDDFGGKRHIETAWGGTHFINCANLTRHHGQWHSIAPMSRHLTFTPGSTELRVRCYLHTSEYAPQGWYAPAERILQLSQPFFV